MTGVEGIGAIIGIADVASRVCISTARFLEESRVAGETRSALYHKVTTLNSILEAVKTTATHREKQFREKPVSSHEDVILKVLGTALKRCKATMERLESKVTSLGSDTTVPNLLHRCMLQFRHQVSGPAIARIERDMQADIGSMQLMLTCLVP